MFKDRLESQVTDQESTIEMWNCSFDKKIDSAFESHVTTSILKIIKLTEGFKGKYLLMNMGDVVTGYCWISHLEYF